jgi:hypothetical protein
MPLERIYGNLGTFPAVEGPSAMAGADAASEHLPCLEITQPFYEDVEI